MIYQTKNNRNVNTTVISHRDEETGLWTILIETKKEKDNTKDNTDPIIHMNKIITTTTELKNSKQMGMKKKNKKKKM